MDYTQYHQLSLWDEDDRILMEDFNSDNARTEAGLALKGNCDILYGTYVGMGAYGADAKKTLTFPGTPLMVIVSGEAYPVVMLNADATTLHPGLITNDLLSLEWGENSVSWYTTTSSAERQLDSLDKTYIYVAFIQKGQ